MAKNPKGQRAFKRELKSGRPLTLTKELIKKISNLIKTGNYIETAVLVAGVPKSTFYYWMKVANALGKRRLKGETKFTPPEKLHLVLLDEIEKAQAVSESWDVAQITQAIQNGCWQAAAWKLERKFPNKWGRKDRYVVDTTIEEVQEDEREKKLLEDERARDKIKDLLDWIGRENNEQGVSEETSKS
jgi:hypothetical protein